MESGAVVFVLCCALMGIGVKFLNMLSVNLDGLGIAILFPMMTHGGGRVFHRYVRLCSVGVVNVVRGPRVCSVCHNLCNFLTFSYLYILMMVVVVCMVLQTFISAPYPSSRYEGWKAVVWCGALS